MRPLVLATLSALLVTASAGAASAQAPAAPEEGRGSAPPPPAFAPPVFGQAVVGDEEPSPDSTPPGLERGGQIVEPSTKPSRFLLQVAAGPRYRRMYSADLSAFQLEVAVGCPAAWVGGAALDFAWSIVMLAVIILISVALGFVN